MKDVLEDMKKEMLVFAGKITDKFCGGEPLDGDETFALSSLFNIMLDLNNGNITYEELESEIEALLDSGFLPIDRKGA